MGKTMTLTLLDKPDYYYELYEYALNEIRNMPLDKRLYFPKKTKDILIVLLEKATEGRIKRKYLRKMVIRDLEKIKRKAWKQITGTLVPLI